MRLSWNAGANWTSYQTQNLTGAESTLSFGSATDTWGRVWDPTEMPNNKFRLEIRNIRGTNCANPSTTNVDWIDVTVTYAQHVQGTTNPALSGVVCRAGDFNFVIDMSGSIGAQGNVPSNLQQVKDGINGFVNSFESQPGASGLYSGTRFNGSAASTITSGYVSASTFESAVNGLNNPSGLTPTSLGITTAEGNNANDRAGVPNVMFVLTDGSPNKPNTHGDDLNNPDTWLQGANAAIGAADSARSSGFVVEAVYLSTPTDPGDTSLPFSDAGDVQWATSVMNGIGGGSALPGDFTGFIEVLFAAIGCPPPPPANLHIAKTANPAGPVAVGSPIGFDISINNSGAGPAADVTIHDALPAGANLDWSLSPAFPGCAITGAVGSEKLDCSFTSVAAGASRGPIHVTSPTGPADCGVIDNTATVDASNDDAKSNGATVTVQCPDVSVVKTPDAGTVNAGDNAVFTMVVTNAGPGSATNVTLSDPLPAGYVWTLGGADKASCSIDTTPNPDLLSCNFGTMTPGTRTVTLTAPTTGQNCAVIPNTATVAASNEKAAGANNTDGAAIDVLCGNVGIVKVANPVGPVSAGSDIGFDVTVSNTGDGAAQAVHVTDNLPAGIVWTADAPTGSASASCSIDTNPTPDVMTCDSASMAAGTNFKVHLHGPTDAADCGVISNTAVASSGNDGGGSSTATVTVQCPDIQVTKTPDGGSVNAGDPLTWTIKVQNLGPGSATGVVVTDTLPSGIAWTKSEADCSITSNVLTCNAGDLAATASKTYTVTGPTTPADCGQVDNFASASATNEPSNKLGNNGDGGTVTVQCADIHITKVALPAGPVDAGSPIGFDVTVSNTGTGSASNVTVVDHLPKGGGLTWSLSPAFTGCAVTGAVGAQDLSCTFASIAAGTAKGPIHVTSQTTAADCGLVSNTATANAGIFGSVEASASVTVQCPSISIEKTALDDEVSAGEVAGFKIVVSNAGPGAANDVVISDVLPAGIAWNVDDTTHCVIVAGTLTCTFDTIAAAGQATVTVTGETGATDCGDLVNTATVTASNDSVGSHSSTADVFVSCPLVVITKQADDTDIVAGDPIGFTITIANTGAGVAFGVTASDPLPAGFDWVIDPANAAWKIEGGVLSFGPATLLPGEDAATSVHITAVSDREDCGTVQNIASFTYLGGGGQDESDVSVRCPSVDLQKTTTDADGKVEPNQTVSYGINVSVVDGPVTSAIVTDDLPAAQTYVADSQSSTPAATSFAVSPDGRTLTWTFATLPSGTDVASITYDVTIDADAAAPQTNEAQVCVADALVVCAADSVQVIPQSPAIEVVKTAGDAADGAVYATEPGNVTYTYVVTNSGPLALHDITVMDDNGTPGEDGDDFAATCPDTTLAAGDSMTCTSTVEVLVDTTNTAVAHGITTEGNPAEASDDAVVDVLAHGLTIDKTNDAPIERIELPDGSTADLPTASEGATVHYTLTYTFSGDPVSNGVITDVLPAGLQYVDPSALGDDQFTFVGYDAGTRTLSWTATTVKASGSVTYSALVLTGANELPQPLANVATIHSDQTEPDDGVSDVFVPVIPAGETDKPTAPPTDVLGTATPTQSGNTLLLVLIGLGALIVGVGIGTPVPARNRRRDRR